MAITYTAHGAAQEVTGSKHLFSFDHQQLLLDCGMFQGKRFEAYQKNEKLSFDPAAITDVILSHGHFDHCGSLPTLCKHGYQGNISCTPPTRDIANLVLMDSAHLQVKDCEFLLKKHPEMQACQPLYDTNDVLKATQQFVTINLHRPFTVAGGVKVEFLDAGHILGSAMTLLSFPHRNGDRGLQVLYTGDVGRPGTPIIRDPDLFPDVDYLICESTYGNRKHDPVEDARAQLADVLSSTFKKGGKVIIPAFAIGRTQELIYHLHLLMDEGRMPKVDIFVDSPMAVNATSIFRVHPQCYDTEVHQRFLDHHQNPFGFSQVHYVMDVEDSKKLNDRAEPCIIIASSGMCEGGRILHHLKNNITNPANTVLIVGFMAQNTLGRRLADRVPEVRIFGETYPLRARVKILNTFSAHADYEDLCRYVGRLNKSRLRGVFLVHGDPDAQANLKTLFEGLGCANVVLPAPGEAHRLG